MDQNLKKYKYHDPEVIKAFEQHCLDGWSPRTFCTRLYGKQPTYDALVKNNEEFKKIHVKFTKKLMKWP